MRKFPHGQKNEKNVLKMTENASKKNLPKNLVL